MILTIENELGGGGQPGIPIGLFDSRLDEEVPNRRRL
jgi:hypothetical protein